MGYKVLELGCGVRPTPGAVHHDKTNHHDWVDVAHDLDVLPWPFENEGFEKVIALDVMEHLRRDISEWLDECWRILVPDGLLVLRVAAWDNPVSYRDPTHRRVFHPETFDYWDPRKPLYKDYGSFYFPGGKGWFVESVERVNGGDLGFVLRKVRHAD